MNYLLEWMGVLSALVGIGIALSLAAGKASDQEDAARPLKRTLRYLALLPPAVILGQVSALPSQADVPATGSPKYAALTQLEQRIRSAGLPVISDDMVLIMRAGKQIEWEPAIFTELASTGRWSETSFLKEIRSRSFAFFITQGHSGNLLYDARHTRSVDQAITEAYPVTEEYSGYIVHECVAARGSSPNGVCN